MLLAAGLGTRMAPLTDRWPKPALPVLDRPLLLLHLEALARHGIERVVINVHAHADQIREVARQAPLPVEISPEPRLLGSAGGIREAAHWLAGPDPFLVVNADMRVEFELEPLLESHRRQEAQITLLLRDDPSKHALGSIGYGINGLVCRVTDRFPRLPISPGEPAEGRPQPRGSRPQEPRPQNMESRVTQGGVTQGGVTQGGVTQGAMREVGSGLFTGIQLMSGGVFEHFPGPGPCELVPQVWIPLLERGERIAAVLQPAAQRWEPVGTPAELLESNLRALRERPETERRSPGSQTQGEIHEPVWIGAGARIDPGARVGPDAVIGHDAHVGAGCELSRTLVLPGTELAPGTRLDGAIAFGREVWRSA